VKVDSMTTHPRSERRQQRGQALVLFTIFLVSLLAATGLVVDVGGAWAQQRSDQKAADAAALAAATVEANGGLKPAIVAAAVASAQANGYTSSEVTVNIPPSQGAYAPGGSQSGPLSANDCSSPALTPCWIEVIISRAHPNAFASIVGQTSWPTAARAVAVGGFANGANNAAPLQFNYRALEQETRGSEEQYCDPQGGPHCPPNTSFPLTAQQFAWTTFCVNHPNNCNVDANTAKAIIANGGFSYTVDLGMYLGPNNHGQMSDVCKTLVAQYPNGADLPVAVSDDNGTLVGFWVWHFDPSNTSCDGQIALSGYFVDNITANLPLTISAGGQRSTYGEVVVRLVE
jgi:hypothetical protein